jgi:hypothetical protein
MLVETSVGCDNINILETTQMFSAARRTMSSAAIANCFQKAGIVLQVAEESESENDCHSDLMNNW